jgi:hypothetical protein
MTSLAPSLLSVRATMLGRYHPRRRPLTMAVIAIIGFIVGSFGGTIRAHAEPTANDKALATMLFQEGRALMAAWHFPEACQKLQESQRLDPGGGTLLNLALCHEQEGRLARSWSEFNEAISVARGDDRADREAEAAHHVAVLEPRLSRLTIVVPAAAQLDGLVIECDGRELGRGSWSTAIPVDGGEHTVRATAQRRQPFSARIVIGQESDSRTVEIPVLAMPVAIVETAFPNATPPLPAEAPPAGRVRWGGVAMVAAGIVTLGVAGYVLSTALKANDASNVDCYVDGCDATGLQQRSVAVSRGNLATLFGVGGLVLVGAGATWLYVGHRSTASRREAQISMRFVLNAAPGALATGIHGGF